MKVCKFGGTSLADAQQIKKVCNIVLSDPERRLVVVSAPGKRYSDDTKVTDMLISLADKALSGTFSEEDLDPVIERYSRIAAELGINSGIQNIIRTDLLNRFKMDLSIPERFMDCIKAAGEDNCAKLIAAYLVSLGKDAKYIDPKDAGLFLTDEYGNAQILEESYQNLSKLKCNTGIMIFPGFFGYSHSGFIVTFPRGGSDITGSILAASVSASVYENFTDVDAVFVANPNIVKNPRPMHYVTYREMRELSYGGFSILHEETIAPVRKAGIPVNIRNTNNPNARGTYIVKSREHKPGEVVGIACGKGFCTLYLTKYLMNREIGFGRRLLQIIEDEGLPFEHMPSGIDDISLVLKEQYFTPEIENNVIMRVKNELHVDSVIVERGLSLLLVVGEGMHNTIGMAARVTDALYKSGINLEMINQGSSEISMMFGIKNQFADKALNATYSEFFGGK